MVALAHAVVTAFGGYWRNSVFLGVWEGVKLQDWIKVLTRSSSGTGAGETWLSVLLLPQASQSPSLL